MKSLTAARIATSSTKRTGSDESIGYWVPATGYRLRSPATCRCRRGRLDTGASFWRERGARRGVAHRHLGPRRLGLDEHTLARRRGGGAKDRRPPLLQVLRRRRAGGR